MKLFLKILVYIWLLVNVPIPAPFSSGSLFAIWIEKTISITMPLSLSLVIISFVVFVVITILGAFCYKNKIKNPPAIVSGIIFLLYTIVYSVGYLLNPNLKNILGNSIAFLFPVLVLVLVYVYVRKKIIEKDS